MPQTKVKKPVKAAARKPAKKAVKKTPSNEIEENFKSIQKAHEETEKAIQKFAKRIDELAEFNKKSIEETRKSLNESIGGLSNTVGNISESLLVPSLVEKFKNLGFKFEIVNRHRKIISVEFDIRTEIDAFLENNNQAMAVEVKTTLKHSDVDYHIERMKNIRRHANLRDDKRQYYGAIAATVIDEDTRRYALKQGLYVIEPSGEDIKIVEPETAKIW